MTIEAPTDGEIFLTYLEQVLGPQLQPGDVVVMDNLAAHKVAGVRESIQGRGAELLYLPPYSPDFNPIEPCWGSGQATAARRQGPLASRTRDLPRRRPRRGDSAQHSSLLPPLRLRTMKLLKML